MGPIEVKKVETIAELGLAAQIRCSVFADEFAYLDPAHYPSGRETDGFDLLPTTVSFIGYVGGEPAATVRLLFPNADVAARCETRLGLSIERNYDLYNLGPELSLAEIPRSAVLGRYRRTGVMRHIYLAAYEESIARGATHWIAAVNMETDCEADGQAVQKLLRIRGLYETEIDARRCTDAKPSGAPRFPIYSEVQRRQIMEGCPADIELPSVLSLYARKCNARYFATAYFDTEFRLLAMPLILRLSDFAVSQYGSAKRSHVDETVANPG